MKGSFVIDFFGTSCSGKAIRASLSGDRDPGYGSTAKMIAETALCLARDVPKKAKGGGFWTPASALGEQLMKRLTKHAGITFEII